MPVYVRGFIIPDVVQVHEAYQKLMLGLDELILTSRRLNRGGSVALTEEGGAVETGAALALAQVRIAYRDFNLGLRRAAETGAIRATKGMIERLDGDRRRPSTGSTPSLRDLVEANPLPAISGFQTGAVGVGNVEILNRAINPHSRGYGPFWRAIEYGTGQGGVPSQIGRILYGSFMEAGGSNPTPPMSEFGGGGGPHPVFKSGYQPSVDGMRTSGLGTIGMEIHPRHFIRYGADGAAVLWRAEIEALQLRQVDELNAIKLGARA